MWKGLRDAGGLANYVGSWFAGDVSQAAMMNPHRAVAMVLEVMLDKLRAPATEAGQKQLDLCVTHDMTIFTMRHGAGLEPVDAEDVKFMDGLIMFERRWQSVFCQSARRRGGSRRRADGLQPIASTVSLQFFQLDPAFCCRVECLLGGG